MSIGRYGTHNMCLWDPKIRRNGFATFIGVERARGQLAAI